MHSSELHRVSIDWRNNVGTLKTFLSMEVCVEPPMRRGSRIHDQLFRALGELNADYLRYSPWFPYPKLAVAELNPPRQGKTFWDFSLLDPVTEDFMQAAHGRPVVFNQSTIPTWMFKTRERVQYPDDPDAISWDYEQGRDLRDPSIKEVADYFARLYQWYTQGGFTDELGNSHTSGHSYRFSYWEVLNEIDLEHQFSPEAYTRLYDAVTERIRSINADQKMAGLVLATTSGHAGYFDYFLDPRNHHPGIPLDMITYHFYATPQGTESMEQMQRTVFGQADNFLSTVDYVEAIRKRLSPQTKTYIDEIGTILGDGKNPTLAASIPRAYWNLSGAMFAYLYARLSARGIENLAEAELIDYPGQFAGTTLVNWETGKPNARYWVLKLIGDSIHRGDKIVDQPVVDGSVFAQGYLSPDGERKLLVVNKTGQDAMVALAGAKGALIRQVNQASGENPPSTTTLEEDSVTLPAYSVSVVVFKATTGS